MDRVERILTPFGPAVIAGDRRVWTEEETLQRWREGQGEPLPPEALRPVPVNKQRYPSLWGHEPVPDRIGAPRHIIVPDASDLLPADVEEALDGMRPPRWIPIIGMAQLFRIRRQDDTDRLHLPEFDEETEEHIHGDERRVQPVRRRGVVRRVRPHRA